MKYLVLLIDGAADTPVAELNGKTPLQAAVKPWIDGLTRQGELGLVRTVPSGMPAGSDVANLSVLGYDPKQYYTGRSPLEAISMGVDLAVSDVAFRCNLVTLSEEAAYENQIMIDYSSDEITTTEAAQLIAAVAQELNTDELTFYSGFSYRHLLVWHQGPIDCQLTPPHDISDRVIGSYLPAGFGREVLLDLMYRSQAILKDHPINQARIARGLHPANSIWIWGQGKKPQLNLFSAKYGLQGTVISAVDLIKGLGICSGMKVVEVPGATGNIHTNFQGKAEATVAAFQSGSDFVYLHFEAPDEAGHRGEIENKVNSITKIDEVLGFILDKLSQIDPEYRIMVLPDHPTPLNIKTHTDAAVPFLIYDSTLPLSNNHTTYDEASAAQTGLQINTGHTLMDRFINV